MAKVSPPGVDPYPEGDAGKKELEDGFVSVDIRMLSQQQQQQYLQDDKDYTKSPRITAVKNCTRKGSLRNGERNNNNKAASSPEGDIHIHTGGPAGNDVTSNVTVDAEAALLPNATTLTASMAVRARKAGGGGCRKSSPWLDPRKIVLLFATLSSVGTLILLYFTLSMGKMSDGDANAR